jgi:hypothetical protein
MAYYIGTNQECEDYNQEVTVGENYHGTTTRWSDIIENPTQVQYAIVKHDNYSSDMEEVEVLPENWYPPIPLIED